MQLESIQAQIRLGAEVCMLLGAFTYLAAAVREARFLGGRMFFENLVNFKFVIKYTETTLSWQKSLSAIEKIF